MKKTVWISGFWAFFAVIAAFSAAIFPARSAAAELGATVTNIAQISFQPNGVTVTSVTPPASFVIEAQRTPSTIAFFRYSPTSPDGIAVQINGTDFVSSTDLSGNPVFTTKSAPISVGAASLDFSAPVTLASAENYFTGEPIFVQVIDAGQNGDPTLVETIIATIVSQAGDQVTLQFYESGVDTGEFFAFIESTRNSTPIDDALLTIVQGDNLTATYQDPFDASEISTDTAGVDPFGLLFDSATGALIDGAEVTIVDAATGQPAQVFGVDGISSYPSTIISGGVVTDASGFIYALTPGEFVFPIMLPGVYRLVVNPPGAYQAPSVATAADVASLPNGPFTIIGASYLAPFTLDGTVDINFDVPLDLNAELVVTKEASANKAAVGDFIRYEISTENIGAGPALLALRDLLPEGFRYQRGSARRDGVLIGDPSIDAGGEALTFAGGIIQAGETIRVTYVAEIASAAKTGYAINRAFVVDGRGQAISNTGQAAVFIQEDLLRSNLTIVGRVAANACTPEDAWPRAIVDGEGVANIRLYMETGAYVVTDEEGLFHFEDVDARTHVVQIDTASLPEGYTPVICEANTRFAGSAISQFVDAQGGSVWQANFYLQKSADTQENPAETDATETTFNDATEYEAFDKTWLNRQDPTNAWAYPAEGRTPSTRSVSLGIKHDARMRVELQLNGAKVPAENYAGRDTSLTGQVAITRWRGVDLVDGENNFTAIMRDADGKEVERLPRRVTFVSKAVRAVLAPSLSHLVADGRNPSMIAVRVTDAAGRPVHAGRRIEVEIDPPYRARDFSQIENRLPITNALTAKTIVSAGPDGVLKIELEPTLQTGKARISVVLDGGRREEFSVYLKPAPRDWIVVGLAEGVASHERTNPGAGPQQAGRDLLSDGRVAVFAKGTIKGDWLVTAAGDTSKRRGNEDNELFDVIDPDARYPLYGDRSNMQFEAQSRYPIYLKAEKGAFQTQFGDYDTGLSDSTLGKYTRRLSGLQTVYEGQRFRFSGFAAETNQDFMRDEIAADGTSGPFNLNAAPLVRNSEKIIVESRNRFRPDEVLSTISLARYVDYDIDFETGELLLRLPIAAASDDKSYNVLVVEYETSAPVERNIVAGGRAAVVFADGRAEAGITYIHEEGRPDAIDSQSDLGAVDLKFNLSEKTKFQVEYGASRRETAFGPEDGDAFLARVEHFSETVRARAYFDQADSEFGLNQQSSGVSGVRRFGGEVSVRIDAFHDEENGRRGERFVDALAYREENLVSGARRSVMEVALRQESDSTSGSVGLRRVVETTSTNEKRESVLATSEIRHNFEDVGLTLSASRDQPIAGQDASNFFPKRTTVGLEQRLFESVTLSVSHEVSENDQATSANTIVGVSAEPWTGARISAAADKITQDSGQRVGATFGVDQQLRIDDKWSASFGVTRREELDSSGSVSLIDDIVPDTPLSPLENNENYTSAYIGAGYRSDLTAGSARLEMRKSTLGNRYTGVIGAAREVSEELSFAGAARLQSNENAIRPDERSFDARLGVAWRPRGDGLIAFNRFDIKQNIVDGEFNSWKAVNNLALSKMLSERFQATLNHGFKYAELNADGVSHGGVTQLVGLEMRYDLTDKFDVGFRGSMLYSHNSNTIDYAYGPSVGFTPAENVWISFGWNITGFVDDDFTAAEFTRDGPFVQLRIKFDQNTAKGLLDSISPGNR